MKTDGVVRKYYYTSVPDDGVQIQQAEQKLKSVGIAPRVFRKDKAKGSKRIDISLSTDMLVHATRRHFEIAILVAGDEDYTPLVRAVQGEGARVHVWFVSNGVTPALQRAADLFVDTFLVGGPKNTLRWHGVVKDGALQLLGQRGTPVSVKGLHNAFHLLEISGEAPQALATTAAAEVAQAATITFGLERDLQHGVRANIQHLEKGLSIIDGGNEKSTEAGRVDITARDSTGRTTIIGLKAGTASPDALTQLLAYMATGGEAGAPVRGILVAGDFHPQLIRAVSILPNVLLVRYRFSFVFEHIK